MFHHPSDVQDLSEHFAVSGVHLLFLFEREGPCLTGIGECRSHASLIDSDLSIYTSFALPDLLEFVKLPPCSTNSNIDLFIKTVVGVDITPKIFVEFYLLQSVVN